ncbi:MAG: TonB-dependent receptor [Steroidobacteraceae bacterium]
MRKPTRIVDHLVCVALAAAVSGPAAAQDARTEPGTGLEEVIVTAQKREENQLDVPISITAVTADMIERSVMHDVTGLQGKVPNANFSDGGVVPGALIPTIRGVGDRAADQLIDQPVLVVVDGVSYSSILGGFLDAFDLEAIEVLRGPQGTLQGRNATGGALNIRTRRPSMTDRQLRTSFEYGNYETWTARAAIDGPIVEDKFAAKVAVIGTDSRGAMDNKFTGDHAGGRRYWMGRLSTLFKPTDNLDMYFTATRVEDDSQQPLGRQINTDVAYPRTETGGQGISVICLAFDVCTPDKSLENHSNYNNRNKTDQTMLSLTADLNLGPATLTSVSGYREVKDYTYLDLDFTPIEFLQVQGQYHDITTWSQEIRLASNDGAGWDANGRLRWVIGAYYFDNEWDLVAPVCLPALGITCDNPDRRGQDMHSYAGFGHIDYALSDQWHLFGGLRETKDKKKLHTEVPAVLKVDDSWSKFTSEFGVKYKWDQNRMAYASYSQGYRTGGINPGGSVYDPETVDAVEVGVKMVVLDNRLSFNAAVFNYDYKDMQRGVVFPKEIPPFYEQGVANAAGATIRGAELELVALPISDLMIGFQLGYLDAEYDNYTDNILNPDGSLTEVDNSHLRIANTPEWTTSASIDYTLPMQAMGLLEETAVHIDYNYRTKFNVHPNDIPLGDQSAYGILNASIRATFAEGKYGVTLFGKNLTDKYYITLADPVAGLSHYAIEGMPRTYGMQVTPNFGL